MIEDRRALAEQIVQLAWLDLPPYDRELLESIGASQWTVTTAALGNVVEDLLRSAGSQHLPPGGVTALDRSAGVWIADLRLVVINALHPALAGLDHHSYEQMVARVAWHEWAHALAVVRATRDDVAAGARLMDLAPAGVARFVRRGGYRASEYTHELVAEIYPILMSRRRRGQRGQPGWLHDEIYELVQEGERMERVGPARRDMSSPTRSRPRKSLPWKPNCCVAKGLTLRGPDSATPTATQNARSRARR